MAEPHASTVVGALAGTGISITGGVLMGAQIDALVVGLATALFVTIWMPSMDTRMKAGSAVLFSSMLAGYGSPVLAAWVASAVPSIAGLSTELRLLGALCISALAPPLFPSVVDRAKQLLGEVKP